MYMLLHISCDLVTRDQHKPRNHVFWNWQPQFVCWLYEFYGAYNEHPTVKQFLAENIPSPIKIGPQNRGFSAKGGLNITFSFKTPKRHILCVQRQGALAVAVARIHGKTSSQNSGKFTRIWRQNPVEITTKFCTRCWYPQSNHMHRIWWRPATWFEHVR